MCRKKKMRGLCLCCFGLGLMVGHSLESWLVCWVGGVALMVLGMCIAQRK